MELNKMSKYELMNLTLRGWCLRHASIRTRLSRFQVIEFFIINQEVGIFFVLILKLSENFGIRRSLKQIPIVFVVNGLVFRLRVLTWKKKIIKYQSNNEINKIPSVNKKSSNELWKDVFATSHEVESTSTISTLTLSKILQKLIIFKTKT